MTTLRLAFNQQRKPQPLICNIWAVLLMVWFLEVVMWLHITHVEKTNMTIPLDKTEVSESGILKTTIQKQYFWQIFKKGLPIQQNEQLSEI